MRISNAIAELRRQIHDDFRRQHPDWVLPNGQSPMCDVYEARLMDLLALRRPTIQWKGFSFRQGRLDKKYLSNLSEIRGLSKRLMP